MLLLTLLPLSAQKRVSEIPVDSTYAYGNGSNYFFYALPKTIFHVKVTAVRTHEYKGIYSEYAEKLLGLTHIISKEQVSYRYKAVELVQDIVPDTSLVYVVEPSTKQISSGLLTSLMLNRSARGEVADFQSMPTAESQIPDFFRFYADLAYADKESNYVETQIVDGVVRQVPASRVQKVARSSEQKAQEAADFIAKIREDRYALLTGTQEVAYSAEAIEKMVSELNALEQNYIQLFTGFTVEEEVVGCFDVEPAANGAPQFLFSLTDEISSVKRSSRVSDNFFLVVKPEQPVQSFLDYKDAVTRDKKFRPNAGYRLRQANPAEVSVMRGNEEIFHLGRVYLYQLGDIEILPLGQDNLDIQKIGIVY